MMREFDPRDPAQMEQYHQKVAESFVEYCARQKVGITNGRGEIIRLITRPSDILFTASQMFYDQERIVVERIYWSPFPGIRILDPKDPASFTPLATLSYHSPESPNNLDIKIYGEANLIHGLGGYTGEYSEILWNRPHVLAGYVQDKHVRLCILCDEKGTVDQILFSLISYQGSNHHNFAPQLLKFRRGKSGNYSFDLTRPRRVDDPFKVDHKSHDGKLEVIIVCENEEYARATFKTVLDSSDIKSRLVSRRLLKDPLTDDLNLDRSWKNAELTRLLGIDLRIRDTSLLTPESKQI